MFAGLAALTGQSEHLTLAKRFRKAWLFDALDRGDDPLTGVHANAQRPEVVGMARWHEVTGESSKRHTCQHFWRRVNEHRAYATGGSNRAEHWGAPGQRVFGVVIQQRMVSPIHLPVFLCF